MICLLHTCRLKLIIISALYTWIVAQLRGIVHTQQGRYFVYLVMLSPYLGMEKQHINVFVCVSTLGRDDATCEWFAGSQQFKSSSHARFTACDGMQDCAVQEAGKHPEFLAKIENSSRGCCWHCLRPNYHSVLVPSLSGKRESHKKLLFPAYESLVFPLSCLKHRGCILSAVTFYYIWVHSTGKVDTLISGFSEVPGSGTQGNSSRISFLLC